MTTLLEMRGISKVFPGVRALDHVNLQVEAGEIGHRGVHAGSIHLATSRWEVPSMTKDDIAAALDATIEEAVLVGLEVLRARTGERVTFDEATQDVMAGGKVFHL